MKLLLTGASGWIGSASAAQLLAAGHRVVGMARGDAAADKIASLGADVVRATLDDLDSLRAAAAGVDGVVHLAYNHDFSRMDEAAATDRAAIATFADVLEGSGGPLLIASGTLGLAAGHLASEQDRPQVATHPRLANAEYTLGLAERGIRAIVVRFAPTVHGAGGDHGFVATLARIAREKGFSGYVGEGLNRWPAVHRLDAAKLVQLAVERAQPGAVLHAVGEEAIAARDIAGALGAYLGLPLASVAPERAAEHFAWLGMFFAADIPASSLLTQRALGWSPQQPTLLQDIAAGHYPGV